MVGFGSCAGTVVDFEVDMNEVLIIGPERVLQTTPGVYFGEAPPHSGFVQSRLVRILLAYEDDLTCPLDARQPMRCRWLHDGWKTLRVHSAVATEDCD